MGTNIPFSASAQRTLTISAPTPYPYLTYEKNSPQFDPRIFSGCILWLDGADPNGTGTPPANGTTLTTWKDKSISNFPFTSVGSSYNTTAVNGLPSINISTNPFGYNPGSAQNNWQEVFAVGLWTGGSTFNTYNGFISSCGENDGGAGGGIIFIGDSGTTNWYNINAYQTPFLNGIQTNTALPTIQTPFCIRTHSTSAVNVTGLQLGVDRSNGRNWIGFISEVICYNTALSSTQRQQVEAYLAQKWKVSSLSTQNIYAPGSYLTFVNPPRIPALPMRRAVQSSKFLPTQISGCQLWLDAADATTITGTTSITAWRDKSGSNNNASFSGTNPSYLAGSNAIITANLNQRFTVPAATIATSTGSGSIFMVYADQQTQGGGFAALFGTASPYNSFYQALIRPDSSYIYMGTTASPTISNVFNTTNPIIYTINYTYASTTGSLRLNGTPYASSFLYAPTPSGALTLSGTGWGDGGNVRLYEVITFTSATALTLTQQQQIEGYLAWKWGLKSKLPPDHPFFFIPPLPLP